MSGRQAPLIGLVGARLEAASADGERAEAGSSGPSRSGGGTGSAGDDEERAGIVGEDERAVDAFVAGGAEADARLAEAVDGGDDGRVAAAAGGDDGRLAPTDGDDGRAGAEEDEAAADDGVGRVAGLAPTVGRLARSALLIDEIDETVPSSSRALVSWLSKSPA